MLRRIGFCNFFIVVLISITFVGCGYIPSAKYSRNVLGDKINTKIIISSSDPANSVIVKDAVDRAIIELFHASLSSKKYADTELTLKISSPSYRAVQYDSNGYIIFYRATITLSIDRDSKGVKKHYISRGSYDFSVDPNAALTDQQRFDAIKYSSIKAISAFVAQVSAEGSKQKHRRKDK